MTPSSDPGSTARGPTREAMEAARKIRRDTKRPWTNDEDAIVAHIASAIDDAFAASKPVVAKIRAYAVECAATCREAEAARLSDIGKRVENAPIMPMLREQHYSWGEKAKSYDALVAFIDALVAAVPEAGR